MSQFRFEEFNPRRHMRGAEAARVTWINDQGEEDTLWMSPADIRGNVQLHGPHYGLLVAASHYHMKADQLVALHRSKGKVYRMIGDHVRHNSKNKRRQG